jgi:hypothetical protein
MGTARTAPALKRPPGTIVIVVRELAQRPVLGVGCCAIPAAAAIESALGDWRGVERVEVDARSGRITVTVSGEGTPAPADLIWSLRMLGLDGDLAGKSAHSDIIHSRYGE